MKTIFVWVFVLFLLLITSHQVFAHRSGCHRWHSCPSDTGSYVCGDLGYFSGCPQQQIILPTATPYPTPFPTSTPVLPTNTPIPTNIPTSKPTMIPTSTKNIIKSPKPTNTPMKIQVQKNSWQRLFGL